MRRFGIDLLASVLVLTLGAAGCADSAGNGLPSADGSAPTAAPSIDPVALAFQWAQCMREQGIDMPDPVLVGGKSEINFEYPPKGSAEALALEEAQRACEQYAASEEGGGRDTPMSDAELAAWQAYAQCMRDNGVEVQDPDPMSDGVSAPDANRHPEQAGVIEAANAACADEYQAARLARALPEP